MFYDGKQTDLEVSISMAKSGDLRFEIVSQHNSAPSNWMRSPKRLRSMFCTGQSGLTTSQR